MSDPVHTLERPTYANGWRQEVPAVAASRSLRPRRSPGRFLLALLLAVVLVLVLVFVSVALRADAKRPVLAVTGNIAAGQQLAATDLVAVRVAVEPGVPVVPADQLDAVEGHTVTVPLVRGALLAPRQVGPAAWPPAGQAVLALPVKTGHSPTGLAAGSTVMVLIAPPSGGGTAAASGAGGAVPARVEQAPATVVGVQPGADQATATTVSLLLSRDDALRLGAVAGGEVTLVQLAPQG